MMNRRWFSAWEAISASPSVSVLLAMSAAICCAGTPQTRNATPQEAGSRSPGDSDESRGILIDRLGFEHALQVRRSKDSLPHEFHDGETLVTGDRMRVSIRTSEAAYLYLAFCAHHELAVYPSQSGIRTQARELLVAPPVGAELVLDVDPGPEVLYVILSRTQLSIADPGLAAALAAKRPSNMPVDCGTSLDAEVAQPRSDAGAAKLPAPSSTNVLRGTVVRQERIPSTHARNGHRPTDAAPKPPDHKPPAPGITMGGPAVPDYERGSEQNPETIVWYRPEGAAGPADVVAADEDGIAVVRHAFTHVAQSSPP